MSDASVNKLIDSGILAYREQDFQSALTLLQSAADKYPRNWSARLYL